MPKERNKLILYLQACYKSKKYIRKNFSIKLGKFRRGKIIIMKKELIIVIIIVIAIIILDIITHNYTKTNFAKMNEQLEQIKEISENIDKMEKGQEQGNTKKQESIKNTDIQNNVENEKDMKPEKQQELQEKIKTMEEDWKTINEKTAFYIEHEELEKVNASMIKFKSYIQLEEYTEAIPELENCKYILDHIRDKEAMQVINLF